MVWAKRGWDDRHAQAQLKVLDKAIDDIDRIAKDLLQSEGKHQIEKVRAWA